MWKEIPGYEGLYKINEYGDVINFRTGNPKLPFINKSSGYKMIELWKNNKGKKYLVHRLVALTYIPNPLNLPMVLHNDNNKLNCYYKNLRWGTGSENILQAYADGLISIPNTHNPYRIYQIYNNDNTISEICNGYKGVMEKIEYGTVATIHNAISQNGKLMYGPFKGCRVRKMYKGIIYD